MEYQKNKITTLREFIQKDPKHPEKKDDELFVGNYTSENFSMVGWKTKRKGTLAYKQDGQPYSYQNIHEVFPVFIKNKKCKKK